MSFDFVKREKSRKQQFKNIWNYTLPIAFSDIAPYYSKANNVVSLGLCERWSKNFVSAIDVRPGQRVLDVCSGTNAVGIALLKKQPNLHISAIDKNSVMQNVGRQLAQIRGFQIKSITADVHHLPFLDNYFDIVTIEWASRHLCVLESFREVSRVLKPGGIFYHCDMLRPRNKILEELYCTYLKITLPIAALMFDSCTETRECRDYFVEAIQMFYSPEEISILLSKTGFCNISSKIMLGGVIAFHKARKCE